MAFVNLLVVNSFILLSPGLTVIEESRLVQRLNDAIIACMVYQMMGAYSSKHIP